MRLWPIAAACLIALPAGAPAARAEPMVIKVCPTQQQSEQIVQSGGSLVPDDCRAVSVTRVDSSPGPMCMLDFSSGGGGILGAIADATITTQWWTPCANLHAP